jgi:hypothetical protein
MSCVDWKVLIFFSVGGPSIEWVGLRREGTALLAIPVGDQVLLALRAFLILASPLHILMLDLLVYRNTFHL